MKKLIVLLFSFLSISAKAGITDSYWFEPTLMCLAGAGGGYATAPKGSETTNAAIGCAVGGLIGYFVNDHYENKFTKNTQKELQDMRKIIKEMELQQAQKVMRGEDESIGIRVREIIPGTQLPDGSVQAPTVREKLVLPSNGITIGE